MKYGLLLTLFFWFNGFAQETEIKQLSFLIKDVSENFKQSKASLTRQYESDSFYTSKVVLNGTTRNEIQIAKDNKSWAIYSASISDSCSFNEAKTLVENWRSIIQQCAFSYKESKMSKKATTLGAPLMGYSYDRYEGAENYWISLTYTKGNLSYYGVLLTIGRQNIK